MALQNVSGLGPEVFARIAVPKVSPNVPITNSQAGTNSLPAGSDSPTSVSTVVFGPNASTALPSGKGGDLWGLVIWSPVDANGSTPDATITFSIGNKSLKQLYIQGGHTHNMFPNPHSVVGGYAATQVKLGVPMRQVYNRLLNGGTVANIPLLTTGMKLPATTPLQVTVTSAAGWGQDGSAQAPLIIDVYGDVWTDAELAAYGALYATRGQFSVSRPPFNPVSGTHTIQGALNSNTIGQLPGGMSQAGAVEILRKMIFATNNLPILTSGQYAYSNLTDVGGQQNQIANVDQDMGDAFATNGNAFIWEEFGVRFAESLIGAGTDPQLYVGMYVNSATWPDIQEHGVLITPNNNPFAYGMVRPQRSEGLYWALKSSNRLLSIISAGANVAPVVSAAGLAQLAANTVTLVKGGTAITMNS